jgi:UDPglucose 6-dehydrogenase
MINYGIVGYGIIGKATHLGILNNVPVKIHDQKLDTNLSLLKNCKIVFFCIPTFDQSDIETMIQMTRELTEMNPQVKIVYRSTVPIGTCQYIYQKYNIHVFYMPEFLRERMWETECQKSELIIGLQDSYEFETLWPHKKIILCSWTEAELVKMFSNNLNAMKTVFANHFYDLSQSTNADYNTVLTLWQEIKNDQSYMNVSSELRGFGGKCLPKDLNFIIDTFADFGIQQQLFTAIKQDNTKWPITKKS